jgi:hypothetical protein
MNYVIINDIKIENFDPMIELKYAISDNLKHNDEDIIHGMRINPTEYTSGWFIWAGEYIDTDNFFHSIHGTHLKETNPKLIKLFNLPPGWRFLIHNDYIDVWFDKIILEST